MGVTFIRKPHVFKGFCAKSKLLFNVFKVLPPERNRNLKNIKQNLTFRTKTLKNVVKRANFEPWEHFLLKNYTFLKVCVPQVYFYLMFLRFRSLLGGTTLKTLNTSLLLARTPLKTQGFLIKVAPTAQN